MRPPACSALVIRTSTQAYLLDSKSSEGLTYYDLSGESAPHTWLGVPARVFMAVK
jgi:hypothetical protein